MRAVVLLATLAACGRFDFGARGDAAARGDAQAVDAARDGNAVASDAPTGCAAHPYELCDDFESADLAPVWMADTDVRIDSTFAHSGTQSAHFSMPASSAGAGAFALLIESSTLPLGDATSYVRAYLRFGSLASGGNAMEIIAAAQASSAHEDALFMSSADLAVYKQWAPEDSEHDLAAPALDTWLCVLFTIQRSTTATGSVALAGDVAPIALTNVQTDGAPPIADLQFGPQLSATNQPDDQPALEMWIDDIIVDKSPVTCAD
ncbi:MAG TPA: hypothetical protein VGF94_22005 [Kofleriaceae bacterium]|jgi:hypothetical protein